MTDPYVWLDPVEEAERAIRAERRAERAYEDGQRAVMRVDSAEAGERFPRVMEAAVEQIARRIAHEVVMPKMREERARYDDPGEMVEREVRALRSAAEPFVGAMLRASDLTASLWASPIDMTDRLTLTYEVGQPFRYNVTAAFERA